MAWFKKKPKSDDGKDNPEQAAEQEAQDAPEETKATQPENPPEESAVQAAQEDSIQEPSPQPQDDPEPKPAPQPAEEEPRGWFGRRRKKKKAQETTPETEESPDSNDQGDAQEPEPTEDLAPDSVGDDLTEEPPTAAPQEEAALEPSTDPQPQPEPEPAQEETRGWFGRRKKKPAPEKTHEEDQPPAPDGVTPQGDEPGEEQIQDAATEAPEPVPLEDQPQPTGDEAPAEQPSDQTQPPAADAGQEIGGEPHPEAEAAEEPLKMGVFARMAARLKRTRAKIADSIDSITLGRDIDDELLDDLEEVLITADMGVSTSLELIENLRGMVRRSELADVEALKQALRKGVADILLSLPQPPDRDHDPHVMMIIGVNGVGKTTTIGKLAHLYSSQGRKVLLGAADTFRAAASEQLAVWAERVGCDMVAQSPGADPSAVAYDAVEAANARGKDLVIIDTAGRLHTKVNLMEELSKVRRVIGGRLEGAPHEVLLVLDATTGQNAVQQAKMFHQATPLTGLILTKLDGTAKGGVVVAIARELGLPILYVGLGEGIEDLRPFKAEEFADAVV